MFQIVACIKSVDYCLLVWAMCVSIDNREQDFRELCIYLLSIVLRDQQILVTRCKYIVKLKLLAMKILQRDFI